jgi:hypothetical protein
VPQPFPVYVVHSRALVDRRGALEAALAALGWTARWIDTPETTSLSYITRRVSPRLSRAQAGVYLKHLEVWKQIAAGSAPRALVLEDDPIFPADFARTFDEYLAALPADAQAVFFGASCGLEAAPVPGKPRFAQVDRARSMSVYLVSREWCARMVEGLGDAPLTQPIDLAVDAIIRRRALPTYWSVPALVENGSESGRFPRAIGKRSWRRFLPAAVAAALLSPVLAVRTTRLAGEIVAAGRELRTHDYEQRRIDGYGYCGGRGYGYVRRVLRRFPEADALPALHYGDTERYASVVLPELRTRVEPRVFVGIGLDWSQTRERMWPATADPVHAGAWTSRPIDFDLLTGVQVIAADTAAIPRSLDLTLYETPARLRVIGRWTLVVPAGAREGLLRVDPPIEQFAIRRGGIDFVLAIAGAATVAGVNLAVVPVDGRGFVVVQNEDGCLTAVSASFLSEIKGSGGPWTEWLADLRRPK